jgi:peptidoglycan/xylan/chitin deacetylase (PgdA/CDA1 family)
VLAALGATAAAVPLAGCAASDGAASGSAASSSAASGSAVSGSTTATASSSAEAMPTGALAASGGSLPAAAVVTRHPAGPDITHGPRTRNAVALTFHGAGDVTILRRMLAEFKDAGASVTVLAIGQWLATDPAVAKLVLDGGHDLGNHTWSHRTMPRLSASDTKTEIARASAELRKLIGTPGSWFRPSGTPHSTATIRSAAVAAGYGACLAYDVDPLDYTDPGANAVVRNFTAGVKAGSIVSLHLGHPGTLAAMPRLLTLLHARGLDAVTASDLLGMR